MENNISNIVEHLKKLEGFLSDENNTPNSSLFDEVTKDINNLFDVDTTVKVGVKLLYEDSKSPIYNLNGDAGADLTVREISSETDTDVTYKFGVALEIPKGHVGLLFPRSSVRKYNLSLSNCVGVIDSNYRGELEATFNRLNKTHLIPQYEVGDRGVQLLIVPIPKIQYEIKDELSETDRNEKGFGSTGS